MLIDLEVVGAGLEIGPSAQRCQFCGVSRGLRGGGAVAISTKVYPGRCGVIIGVPDGSGCCTGVASDVHTSRVSFHIHSDFFFTAFPSLISSTLSVSICIRSDGARGIIHNIDGMYSLAISGANRGGGVSGWLVVSRSFADSTRRQIQERQSVSALGVLRGSNILRFRFCRQVVREVKSAECGEPARRAGVHPRILE